MITPKSREAHAARVLREYPQDRARALLALARLENRWPHVDWAAVERGLGPAPASAPATIAGLGQLARRDFGV
jgi:hypothetical protein